MPGDLKKHVFIGNVKVFLDLRQTFGTKMEENREFEKMRSYRFCIKNLFKCPKILSNTLDGPFRLPRMSSQVLGPLPKLGLDLVPTLSLRWCTLRTFSN